MKHTTRGDNGTSMVLIAPVAIVGTTPIPITFPMGQFDGVGLVLVTTGTVAGAWTIQAADDFQPSGLTGLQNVPANAGNFGPVSTLCAPALVAAAGSPTKQAVQIVPFMWSTGLLTFTPTSGAGNVAAYIYCKGNS